MMVGNFTFFSFGFCFLLILTGCPNTGTKTEPAPPALGKSILECSADSDCTVVELKCCDHCNGGMVVSVNSGHVEDVKKEYGEVCSPTHGCTLKACSEELPRCEGNTCTHYPDPNSPLLDRMKPSVEDIKSLAPYLVACEVNDDCSVVETGCCDHCNGVSVVSVRRQYAMDVEAYYAGLCPADTV